MMVALSERSHSRTITYLEIMGSRLAYLVFGDLGPLETKINEVLATRGLPKLDM